MGILWPKSGDIIRDNNDERAPGAKAFFYEAGTSTPLTTYSDAALTTPRTHPVLADGNGRWPAVFLDFGSYKLIITTSGGTTLFTTDNIPNEAPTDPSDTVDANALLTTGDVWWSPLDATRAGAVRLNGRTLGSATSGATERANADTENLFAFLWNNLANGQAPVSTGRGASAAADFAANKTITLPDLRGALPIGLTDMGNTDSGGLASAPVTSGSAIIPGSVLGANTHALTEAQLAAHAHAVNGTTSGQSADHTHGVNGTTGPGGTHTHTGTTGNESVSHTHTGAVGTVGTTNWQGGGPAAVVTSVGTTTSGAASNTHTHDFTMTTQADHTHNINITSATTSVDHTHSFSAASATVGSGTAHNIVSKVLTGTYFIRL